MSQQASQAVAVKLLDKEYSFNCPQDGEQALHASANFLHEKMLEIRQSGRVIGLERIAIMAALNIAHELLQAKEQNTESLNEKFSLVQNKIDSALNTMERSAQKP